MTIIESEQSKDTRLTEIKRGPFILRFASYRKNEDAKIGLRSEDYFVTDISPTKASFVLCDGVGSSFYGNIGSQFLGEIILHWLQNIALPNNLSGAAISEWQNSLKSNLKKELTNVVPLATSIVNEKEITSAEELIRVAEKNQRDDFGTQSNFVCGVVWPQTPRLPNGLAVLFWLGNARLRLFNNNQDLTNLLDWGANPDQLREVWSSKDGVVGTVYSYCTDLKQVTDFIAYSDGLENFDQSVLPNLNGAVIEELVKNAQVIKDDDVSFIELAVSTSAPEMFLDDIANKIRNRYVALPSSNTLLLQKKYEDLLETSNKLKGTIEKLKRNLVSLAIGLTILSCVLGVLAGGLITRYRVTSSIESPTATNFILTSIITSTFQVPTATLSETPTGTTTETLTTTPSGTSTETPTETATGTSTATSTDTATATFTATPTATLAPPSLQ